MGPLGHNTGDDQPAAPLFAPDPDPGDSLRPAPEAPRGERLPEFRLMAPTRFGAATEVIRSVRAGVTVLVDVSAMAGSRGQRLIDFACGGVTAIGGQSQRLGEGVFLFAPALLLLHDL